jgi:hypothetical protein
MTGRSGTSEVREHIARLQTWLERLRIWRVWERMLEIELLDRSIALAGKASTFPPVIVVAALSTNASSHPGRAGRPNRRHP